MESSISTIVLLAVTITVAVSVAYWMGGINAIYAQFEKVEVSSISCNMIRGLTRNYWEIEISCKNSGPKSTTLDSIYVNNLKIDTIGLVPPIGSICTTLTIDNRILNSGESVRFSILVDGAYANISSGTSVNIRIRAASGMDYNMIVVLI